MQLNFIFWSRIWSEFVQNAVILKLDLISWFFGSKLKWGTRPLKWCIFELKISQNKSRVKGSELASFWKLSKCDLPPCNLNWYHQVDPYFKIVDFHRQKCTFSSRIGGTSDEVNQDQYFVRFFWWNIWFYSSAQTKGNPQHFFISNDISNAGIRRIVTLFSGVGVKKWGHFNGAKSRSLKRKMRDGEGADVNYVDIIIIIS